MELDINTTPNSLNMWIMFNYNIHNITLQDLINNKYNYDELTIHGGGENINLLEILEKSLLNNVIISFDITYLTQDKLFTCKLFNMFANYVISNNIPLRILQVNRIHTNMLNKLEELLLLNTIEYLHVDSGFRWNGRIYDILLQNISITIFNVYDSFINHQQILKLSQTNFNLIEFKSYNYAINNCPIIRKQLKLNRKNREKRNSTLKQLTNAVIQRPFEFCCQYIYCLIISLSLRYCNIIFFLLLSLSIYIPIKLFHSSKLISSLL